MIKKKKGKVPLRDVTKKVAIIKIPRSPKIPIEGLIGRKLPANEILLRALKDFLRTKDLSIYDNTKRALKLMNKREEIHSEIDKLGRESDILYQEKAKEDSEAARQVLVLSRDQIKGKEKELEHVDAEILKNIVFLNERKGKFKEILPPITQKVGVFIKLDGLAKKLETDIKARDKRMAIKRVIEIDRVIEEWRKGKG